MGSCVARQIDLREFWEYLDVIRTPFSVRAFGLFDEDGSGEIDLGEFMISLYNYCRCHGTGL